MEGPEIEETVRCATEYVKSAAPDKHGSGIHVPWGRL